MFFDSQPLLTKALTLHYINIWDTPRWKHLCDCFITMYNFHQCNKRAYFHTEPHIVAVILYNTPQHTQQPSSLAAFSPLGCRWRCDKMCLRCVQLLGDFPYEYLQPVVLLLQLRALWWVSCMCRLALSRLFLIAMLFLSRRSQYSMVYLVSQGGWEEGRKVL